MKMHVNMSSAKWWPFGPGGDGLISNHWPRADWLTCGMDACDVVVTGRCHYCHTYCYCYFQCSRIPNNTHGQRSLYKYSQWRQNNKNEYFRVFLSMITFAALDCQNSVPMYSLVQLCILFYCPVISNCIFWQFDCLHIAVVEECSY